jgi:hypothetical protein
MNKPDRPLHKETIKNIITPSQQLNEKCSQKKTQEVFFGYCE